MALTAAGANKSTAVGFNLKRLRFWRPEFTGSG
jgi:hypothetical protein